MKVSDIQKARDLLSVFNAKAKLIDLLKGDGKIVVVFAPADRTHNEQQIVSSNQQGSILPEELDGSIKTLLIAQLEREAKAIKTQIEAIGVTFDMGGEE